MPSSWMLRRVALVRTDVSEELSSSFISATRIGELGITITVTSNRRTLRRNTRVRRLLVTVIVVPSSPILVALMIQALSSSEISVLTRAARRNIPEDDILHSHRRENLKSYIQNRTLSGWRSPYGSGQCSLHTGTGPYGHCGLLKRKVGLLQSMSGFAA
jgi:hypothetical protein